MAALTGDRGAGTGWRAVFLEMLVGLREAVFRFPLATIFLLVSTIQAHLLIADIHLFQVEGQDGVIDDSELVLGLTSGALAALAATLFGEAHSHPRLARSAMALTAGLAVSALIALPQTFLVLQWTLVLAVIGLVLVAPFIGRGGSGPFWMFSARAAFAALLGILALLLLAGGISAILASLTLLFGLSVPDELYEHVWAFTGLFAAPLFAMGQLPARFDETPGVIAEGFMDRGMRALGDFVAAPLLILYAVILHLYALKILVTREVPEGQIGWLVLVYGLCIFGALLVINPFFDRARAPTRLFLRLWPFFLPVPLVLLFYALALRVGEFGVTPDRFLLGLFGAVAALILVLQLFPRLRGDIRVIAGLPIAALLLASFGPQGALGISLGSQANRFLDIVRNPPIEGEQHQEALNALSFLSGHSALSRVQPEGTDISPIANDAYQATALAWGLDPQRPRPGLRGFMLSDSSNPAAFTVTGFDTVVQNVVLATNAKEPMSVRLPSGMEISFALESEALLVTAGEETVRFPISAKRVGGMARLEGTDRLAEFPLEADGRRIVLVPSYLYADIGQPPQLANLSGTVLLRSQDWASR